MLDISDLIERHGEPGIAAVFGFVVGLLLRVAAQQSGFCLRSATVKFLERLGAGFGEGERLRERAAGV